MIVAETPTPVSGVPAEVARMTVKVSVCSFCTSALTGMRTPFVSGSPGLKVT